MGISGYQMAIRHGQVESTRHAVHQRPSRTNMALLRAQQVTFDKAYQVYLIITVAASCSVHAQNAQVSRSTGECVLRWRQQAQVNVLRSFSNKVLPAGGALPTRPA